MIIGHKGYKIFAFADTHGMYRRLTVPEADVLICAGDACEGFNPADLKDFFDWYSSQPSSESLSLVTMTWSSIRTRRAPGL